jgi:hypothetical protein
MAFLVIPQCSHKQRLIFRTSLKYKLNIFIVTVIIQIVESSTRRSSNVRNPITKITPEDAAMRKDT